MGLRSKIRNRLLNHGTFVPSNSLETDVLDFIRSVRPVGTEHTLIRVGGQRDGGYLLPDCLDGIAACFSPGTSFTADFELSLADRGIPSFMADYSVPKAPIDHPLFSFERRYLGSHTDDVFMTLESWINRQSISSGSDLLLQMDIEGFEYDVLMDTTETLLRRFRIIVIEFHGFESLFNRYGLKMISYCMGKLLPSFHVVHIHPNNCEGFVTRYGVEVPRVAEFTFLRKDYVKQISKIDRLPHQLDVQNVPTNPPVDLHPFWYQGL